MLEERIGPERVIWRYDPVILTSATPVSWHIEQLEQLAGQLADSTPRLMFSFYDFYGKGQGHLNRALQGTGIDLEDIRTPGKSSELEMLVRGFKQVADRYDLQLFSCSESIDLFVLGVEHGSCIDGELISKLFAAHPSTTKDKNQRPACGCVESVDMGMYNSCPFLCSYCYANSNPGVIENNLQKHFRDSPTMLGRHEEERIEIRTGLKKNPNKSGQQSLF